MSDEQVKKNHVFNMSFVMGEMPHKDKFIKDVADLLEKPATAEKPRSLKMMEAVVGLAEKNPDHQEYVMRCLRSGSFKRLARYVDKLDGPIKDHKEIRVEPKPREKSAEEMTAKESKIANHAYCLQVETGHIPRSDEYVADVKKIMEGSSKSKDSKPLQLLKANVEFAKKDPKFSGVILRAMGESHWYKATGKFLAEEHDKEQAVKAKAMQAGKQR